MIPLKDIQKTHPQVTIRYINQLVYFRNRVRILRTCSIKVGKINANFPYPTLLPHHYNVSQPLWIKYLFDSPSLFQILHFFHDFRMVFGGLPQLLLFGWELRVHVQFVHYKLRIDTRYFIWALGEII